MLNPFIGVSTIAPSWITGLYPHTDSNRRVKTNINIVETTVLTPNFGPKMMVPIISRGISIQIAYNAIFQGHKVFSTFDKPYVPPGAIK